MGARQCKGQPRRIAWAVNPTAANLPLQTASLRHLLSERRKNPSFELILFDSSMMHNLTPPDSLGAWAAVSFHLYWLLIYNY